MAHLNHLPIWRGANRLLVIIEEAVRRFPRYHKSFKEFQTVSELAVALGKPISGTGGGCCNGAM